MLHLHRLLFTCKLCPFNFSLYLIEKDHVFGSKSGEQSESRDEQPAMTVKLEIAYIPIILPNHVHLTSSLHHQIDQTFPRLVDKKIIARIMFAGEREGLGTRLGLGTSRVVLGIQFSCNFVASQTKCTATACALYFINRAKLCCRYKAASIDVIKRSAKDVSFLSFSASVSKVGIRFCRCLFREKQCRKIIEPSFCTRHWTL